MDRKDKFFSHISIDIGKGGDFYGKLLEKLEILGTAAKFDVCAASYSNKRIQGASFGAVSPSGVCHSFTPDGRCISLFKVLMTNECEQDCGYCQNNCYRDIPRARFTPDELVQLL